MENLHMRETSAVVTRRRNQRLEVVSLLQTAADQEGTESVLVLNISEGGALIYSRLPLRVDDTHEFRFMTAQEPRTALCFRARIAHVAEKTDLLAGFLTGLQFMEPLTD